MQAFKFLLLPFTIFIIMWTAGFLYFIRLVPNKPNDIVKTDAIVVLTGGEKRIEEGLGLFKQKAADRLFITGVDTKVKRLHEVTSRYVALSSEDKQKIEFGQDAGNTIGNAREVKEWIAKNNIKSITLVTANYHMPRSLTIFRSTFPTLKIAAYPVFPPNFKMHKWWHYPGSALLLLKEYSKWLFISYKTRI